MLAGMELPVPGTSPFAALVNPNQFCLVNAAVQPCAAGSGILPQWLLPPSMTLQFLGPNSVPGAVPGARTGDVILRESSCGKAWTHLGVRGRLWTLRTP